MAMQEGRFEGCCRGLCGSKAFEGCCGAFEAFKACPKRATWQFRSPMLVGPMGRDDGNANGTLRKLLRKVVRF